MNRVFIVARSIVPLLIIFTLGLSPHNGFALTLKEGLEVVTSTNRDVLISQIEENAAQYQLLKAQSQYFPKVDAYGDYTARAYQPKGNYNLAVMGLGSGHMQLPMQDKDFYVYGLSLNQTIYDFGRTTHSVNAAKYYAGFNSLNIKAVKNTAALAYIIGYYSLLNADRNIILSQTQVKNLEAHLSDTEELNKEGLNIKNDVLKVEVILTDARQKLLTANNDRSINEARLNNLLSKPLNNSLTVEENGCEPDFNLDLDKAWEMAERERIELKAIKEKIHAKEEEISVSNSEYYPNLYLSAGYDRLTNSYMVRDDNWSLVVGVKINLFSGGATKYQSSKIFEELRELKLKNEDMLEDIKLQVEGAYLNHKLALQKVEAASKSVEQAKENLRVQELRFKEGIGTNTDVLDAITLLNKIETDYWNSVYEIKISLARFIYCVGLDLVSVYNK